MSKTEAIPPPQPPEKLPRCPTCSAPSVITDIGSASGHKYLRCTNNACGIAFLAKNPHQQAAARARMSKLTPEQRSRQAKDAVEKRWRDAKLSQNVTAADLKRHIPAGKK